MTNPENGRSSQNQDLKPRPAYQPPKIVTYTSEEILEQVGPALACTPTEGSPF